LLLLGFFVGLVVEFVAESPLFAEEKVEDEVFVLPIPPPLALLLRLSCAFK
jgi:hypothetical protein